jgi:hypothetical protein
MKENDARALSLAAACPTLSTMPGQLPGMYFKLVIGNLLSAQLMFPDLQKRIDAMRPDELHDWDEYTNMMQKLASVMPSGTIVQVGKKIVRDSKAFFMSQGFDSTEKILGDWGKLFAANIVGAPPRDMVKTTHFGPNEAVLLAGIAQPASLVEGYMRGVVEMFGHRVSHFEATLVSLAGVEYNKLLIRWK